MKTNVLKPILVLAITAGFSLNANAQAPSCDNITWNAVALERLPTAEQHCLEVVERNGGWYAKMRARIIRQNPASTTVKFQNADGTWSDSERVHPPQGMTAEIDGRPVRVAQLQPGQEVNVYALSDEYFAVPAQVAAAEPEPAAAAAEPEPEMESEAEPAYEPAPTALPKTAGNANWLALAGTLLVLLSAGLYLRRNL